MAKGSDGPETVGKYDSYGTQRPYQIDLPDFKEWRLRISMEIGGQAMVCVPIGHLMSLKGITKSANVGVLYGSLTTSDKPTAWSRRGRKTLLLIWKAAERRDSRSDLLIPGLAWQELFASGAHFAFHVGH